MQRARRGAYAPGAHGEKKVTETTPFPVDAGTPRFRRIHLSNITARRVKNQPNLADSAAMRMSQYSEMSIP